MSDYGERTRWMGDSYESRYRKDPDGPVKRLALVQTPVFVGEFLLDRTLLPALEEFPLDGFRLIDPCCGCGHLLCQAFDRFWERWSRDRPETDLVLRARHCLESIHGIELDPLALEIARLRLVVCACDAAGVLGYSAKWGFRPIVEHNVVWADALLPADHPLQPFACQRSELVPMYGQYRTMQTMLKGGETG
jgi:hypothetical protein